MTHPGGIRIDTIFPRSPRSTAYSSTSCLLSLPITTLATSLAAVEPGGVDAGNPSFQHLVYPGGMHIDIIFHTRLGMTTYSSTSCWLSSSTLHSFGLVDSSSSNRLRSGRFRWCRERKSFLIPSRARRYSHGHDVSPDTKTANVVFSLVVTILVNSMEALCSWLTTQNRSTPSNNNLWWLR
jgi:hypothetical protein